MKQEQSDIELVIVRFLEGTITGEEKAALSAWLESDAAHRRLFLDYYRLWSRSALGHDDRKKEEAWNSWVKRYGKRRRSDRKAKIRLFFLYGAAAAVIGWLVVVSAGPFFLRPTESELMQYARENRRPNDTIREIQLKISREKTVLLAEKEPSIRYTPEAVRVEKADTIARQASSTYNELIVPYGKRSMLTLSDGSRIWVNAGTRLVYPFTFEKHRRELFADGEIYLEVSPDRNRPFIVKTPRMTVRVLGTKFNVTDYEDDRTQKVVLISGAVRVGNNARKKETELRPEQLYTSTGEEESVRPVDPGPYIAWISGLCLFQSEPLEEILNRLTRYYGIPVECSPELAGVPCSGKLDLKDDPDELLNGLAETVTAVCRRTPEGGYRFEKK